MKKVLILDNDPDVLDVIQEILTYEGYEIKGLTDTENIFKPLDEYKPDIVLIDYILNGINGGEICHQIKTSPATAGLPVILLSAYPRVLQSLGTYGCDAFIAKPFNLLDLTHQIHQLLDQSVSSTHTYSA
jgi:CheY-like chemotaxis protein